MRPESRPGTPFSAPNPSRQRNCRRQREEEVFVMLGGRVAWGPAGPAPPGALPRMGLRWQGLLPSGTSSPFPGRPPGCGCRAGGQGAAAAQCSGDFLGNAPTTPPPPRPPPERPAEKTSPSQEILSAQLPGPTQVTPHLPRPRQCPPPSLPVLCPPH